jgi:hypothetical protein
VAFQVPGANAVGVASLCAVQTPRGLEMWAGYDNGVIRAWGAKKGVEALIGEMNGHTGAVSGRAVMGWVTLRALPGDAKSFAGWFSGELHGGDGFARVEWLRRQDPRGVERVHAHPAAHHP